MIAESAAPNTSPLGAPGFVLYLAYEAEDNVCLE